MSAQGLAHRVAEAQAIVAVRIMGVARARVAYGKERVGWDTRVQCHDCSVVAGQLHVLGCDVEECPGCSRPLASCDCTHACDTGEEEDDDDDDDDDARGDDDEADADDEDDGDGDDDDDADDDEGGDDRDGDRGEGDDDDDDPGGDDRGDPDRLPVSFQRH